MADYNPFGFTDAGIMQNPTPEAQDLMRRFPHLFPGQVAPQKYDPMTSYPIPNAAPGAPAYPIPTPPTNYVPDAMRMPNDYYRTQRQMGTQNNQIPMDQHLNMLLQLMFARKAGQT